jgi:hypothetical protein
MHLKVFLKLKKTLKTLSSGQIYKKNKKPKKNKKKQKTHWAGFFKKKNRVFPTLQQVALEILANLCTGEAEDSWEEDNSNISDNEEEVEEGGVENGVEVSVADPDPPYPHVFGPPGSGSTSMRYGSGSTSMRYGSGSFYYHAKIVRKTLIFTIL